MNPSLAAKMEKKRLIPSGVCWCGCEQDVALGKFFAPGHDKVAESAVILVKYGGVPQFLTAHGFGPGGCNARAEVERWKADRSSR